MDASQFPVIDFETGKINWANVHPWLTRYGSAVQALYAALIQIDGYKGTIQTSANVLAEQTEQLAIHRDVEARLLELLGEEDLIQAVTDLKRTIATYERLVVKIKTALRGDETDDPVRLAEIRMGEIEQQEGRREEWFHIVHDIHENPRVMALLERWAPGIAKRVNASIPDAPRRR